MLFKKNSFSIQTSVLLKFKADFQNDVTQSSSVVPISSIGKKITTNYFLNLGARSKINKHSSVIKSNMMVSARTLLLCLMKQKCKNDF